MALLSSRLPKCPSTSHYEGANTGQWTDDPADFINTMLKIGKKTAKNQYQMQRPEGYRKRVMIVHKGAWIGL